MKRSTAAAIIFSLFLLSLWSCSKDSQNTNTSVPTLRAKTYEYSASASDKASFVSWIEVSVIGKINNPLSGLTIPQTTVVSNNGVTLGRVIFYDKGTSININNNCNSCHTTPPVPPSDQEMVARKNKSVSPHAGIQEPVLMVERMKTKSYYASLFQAAYGTADITPERISDALAQYMAAMASVGSQQALAADVRFADPFK